MVRRPPRSHLLRDLAPEMLIRGALLCVDNARSLGSAADDLHLRGKHGHAIALLVLAAEEAIKGIGYYACALGIPLHEDGADHLAHSHGPRLALSKALLRVAFLAEKIVEENKVETADDETFMRLFEGLVEITLDPPTEIKELGEWWSRANRIKKSGLYVDYTGDDWVNPSEITAEAFQHGRQMVAKVLTGARLLLIMHRRHDGGALLQSMVPEDFEALGRKISERLHERFKDDPRFLELLKDDE